MKLLLIHQNFPGQFKNIVPALLMRGHQVVAIGVNSIKGPMNGVRYLRHRPVAPKGTLRDMSDTELDWLSRRARADSAAHAMEALKREGFLPDVVFGHPGWGEMLFARDIFPRAKHLILAEYYYGNEGGDSHFDPEFHHHIGDLEARKRLRLKNTHLLHSLVDCDAAVSPTFFQKSRHPAIVRDRIQVIHEGIDTDYFLPNENASVSLARDGIKLQPGDEVVTFVARQLEPYRGYHIFMRSLQRLQELRPQARVVIVGGSGTAYGAKPPHGKTWKDIFLAEVKNQLNMDRVHFVGPVSHNVLRQLLQVSAAHVYLTYPFVLSWSMLEAMSLGCVVVASKTAPVEEVIKHGQNGFLVEFFDYQALAKSVAEALACGADLQVMRQAARGTVVENYDLSRLCLPAMLKFILEA